MMMNYQILMHNEVRPLEESLQVYPGYLLQLYLHPTLCPLSHSSIPGLMKSPHVVEHTEATPTIPVHMYPVSTLQFKVQPGCLPLSQTSEAVRI
jgi:hypothetical protein